jgi:hypothetical protein
MITFDQLTELIKAGCTQDQIQLINRMMDGTEKPTAPAGAATNTDPSPDPAPNAKTDPKPEPAPANPDANKDPSPAPDPTPDPTKSDPAPAEESETVKMLKEMLGIMQKGALNTLQQNQPEKQSAEQILASVLNP